MKQKTNHKQKLILRLFQGGKWVGGVCVCMCVFFYFF